ncbi:MAG: diphosphomevalonate decarboxylase [Deltaproteobacteria bacterium]|nr:diphosphomevalonate decarboxylase [Deltaproteobacteria bacterium]
MKSVSAIAHSNIALIKYWGKADTEKNLPATGSLSLTLDAFYTQTQLREAEADRFLLDGKEQSGERLERVKNFLDKARKLSGKNIYCDVLSKNHVPTEAGFASSASGFAALAQAVNSFFELGLAPRELSALARQGSGSAARSIFPGLVKMSQEGFAEPVSPRPPSRGPGYGKGTGSRVKPGMTTDGLDLRLLVVQCSAVKKPMSSREAMNLTTKTSPYYSAWLSSHQADLDDALEAIKQADFSKLGELTEYSALKMHASLMAAKPGFWYFEPTTIAVMNEVRDLRRTGLEGYLTLDAGPQVKVLCLNKDAAWWQKKLQEIPGVLNVTLAGPGPGAYDL